jgi:transcription-repair coupling factor (superfamily II helicase)
VQNIEEVAGMIKRLCPDLRIAIGHGQMPGHKLEEVMVDFIDGHYDVLVATSIIRVGS